MNSPAVKEGMELPVAPRPSLLRRVVQGALGLGLLGGLVWLLLRQVDWREFLTALRAMDVRFLVAAMVVDITLNLTAFVQRLRTLLRAFPVRRRESFIDLALLSAAGYAAGALLPGQPGIALRTVELRRRFGYQYSDVIGAQLVEKLIEVVSISLLGWLALLGHPPAALALPLWLVTLGAPLGAGVLLLGSRWSRRRDAEAAPEPQASWRQRVHQALRRFAESLERLQDPWLLLRALAWSLTSHLCGVAAVGLCLLGMGLHLSVPTWALLYMVVNLALVMPLTPGQVGIVEAGVVGAMQLLGVAREPALAFAIVYHAAQVLPTTLLGIAVLPAIAATSRRRTAEDGDGGPPAVPGRGAT